MLSLLGSIGSIRDGDMSEGEGPVGTKEVEVSQRSNAQMIVKRLVQGCFVLWIFPRLLAYRLGERLLGERAFLGASESIARKPGMWGVFLRQAFYGQLLSSCGKDVYIGWGTVFSMREASLGDKAYVGRNCNLGYAKVGQNVMLADNVVVLSGGKEHSTDVRAGSMHDQVQVYSEVSIGDGAWIGAGAIIMANVGRECIIGAGAVVNKPIADGAVAVGVPARVVKYREGYGERTDVRN
jgi:acetyltransferase-like isoleucine patch superfamily enzyme